MSRGFRPNNPFAGMSDLKKLGDDLNAERTKKDLDAIRSDAKESVGAERKKRILFSGKIKNPAVLAYISKLPVTSSELIDIEKHGADRFFRIKNYGGTYLGIDDSAVDAVDTSIGGNFKRFLKSNPEIAAKHVAYIERAEPSKERLKKDYDKIQDDRYRQSTKAADRESQNKTFNNKPVGKAVVPKNTAPLNAPYDPVEAAKKLAPSQDIPAPNNTVSKVVSEEAQKVAKEAQEAKVANEVREAQEAQARARAAYERNQEMMRANREAKAVAPKVIDDRIKTDLFSYNTGLTDEEARIRLQNRDISPTNFYSPEDWKANDQVSRGSSPVRIVGGRKYDAFSNILDYYNETIDNYVINSGMTQQEARAFRQQFKQSRGHLSPKGNYAWSHKRDVDGNLILEHLGDNIDSKARSNFATMVNSMEARMRGGVQIPAEEMARYKEFLEIARRDGMDVRTLQNNFDALNENYGKYEVKIDPSDARYNQNFFTAQGNFRKYEDMLDKGYVTTPEEHEKIRRLFITLMDADPETDLDSFMSRPASMGTKELQSGILDSSPDWKEVRSGNRSAGEKLNKSAKILELLKKHPAGIAGLLAVAGAAHASGGEEDASYLDRVLKGLEWMDTQTTQGDNAISNVPGVSAVKNAWNSFTGFLNDNVDTVNVGPGGTYQAPVSNVGDAANAVVSLVNPYEELAFGLGWAMPDKVEPQQVEQQPYYTGSGFQAIDEHDAKVNRGMLRNMWFSDD